MRLLIKTLTRVTVIPAFNPYKYRVVKVIILARPNLNHGTGVGINASMLCSPTAYAERRAMWIVSELLLSLVTHLICFI
jgi:hypothetical protein